jgi:eukaryotic-like serine/threonine-protein kinase
MKAERWKQIDALFDAVEELPFERREAFLDEACAGDEELRREVLSLLAEQAKVADGFMERSAMKVVAEGLAERTVFQSVPFANREVGIYKIERLLGAGGMGEIYLAHDGRLKRKVALKILPAEFVSDAERLRRFEREARVVSALNHPNIVTIYDVGEADGCHFIATEYVEGKTLRALAAEKLSLKEILSFAAQAAEALSAAHGAGVVHRDIKPENIMVRADGYVKVLDFGLAKLTEPDVNPQTNTRDASAVETQAGVVMGTLAYMSPEQATGEPVDHRTDIWSLGVVLYELATGEKPFARENRQATINAILSGDPETVSASDPDLPEELDHVLCKALEKDRELRYQTASDFRADLRRLLRAMDSSPSWSSGKVVAARRSKPQRRFAPVAVAASLILLAVACFIAWRFYGARSGAPDWSRATNTQLTDQAGTEFFPSLSPDGKSFVYASNQSGNLDLYLQRVGGKNQTNLTKDSEANDSQPAFSPDGEHIAFRSEREPEGIYLMEATGENVRRISDSGFHPSWSPDGKEIVYSSAGRDTPDIRNTNPSELWIVNVETGARRMLIKTDAMQPAWSPNGRRIAYWFMPPNVGRSDIATIASAGGEPVVITKDASTNWNPVWSPDGKFLYFASDRSGNMNFWRVRVDEETGQLLSEPEAVVTPSKFSRHLNFSRDGKRMIYVQTDNQSNIQAVGFDARSEKPTGEPVWITRGDRQVARPELSPDGRQFVMRLPRRTQDDIVLVNRDGTNWRDLTNDKFFDRYPRWSPDGKKIAFVSDRSGVYEIWMIDADGTNLRQLTFGSSPGTSFPIWSPDGQRLIFRRNERDTVILDLNKNSNEQKFEPLPVSLDNRSEVFAVWDWSPDGKKLAGTFSRHDGISGDNGVGIAAGYFSFETNRYEKVLDIYVIPYWLPDSRRFVYAHEGKAFIADAFTKKSHELISRQPEQIRSVGVSRDNHLLYYTVLSSESDIWLLSLE